MSRGLWAGALLLLLAILTGACHHAVPPTQPPHVNYWGLSPDVKDSDGFCIIHEGRFYCVSVANLKQYLIQHLYSE